MKRVRGRLILLALFVVFSLLFFLPTMPILYDPLPRWMKQVLPEKGIALGLDLQGGIHIVLEVDEDRAVEIAVDRNVNAMQDLLIDKKIPVESVERTSQAQVTFSFQDAQLKPDIQKALEEFQTFYEVQASGTDNALVYALREGEVKRIKSTVIEQALETIRNRIDQFGVTEPLLAQQGLRQIVVQLPGVKDPKRAKELIKGTAILEFKMLDEESPVARELPSQVPMAKNWNVIVPVGGKVLRVATIAFS